MSSVRVDASPEEVWAVLADFGGIAGWAGPVDHSCVVSSETAGVDAVRRIQTGRNVVLERVVDWEEPSTLAYRIEGLPPVLRSVVNRWTVDGDASGSVVVLDTVVEAGPRPPQRVVARVVSRRLAAVAEQLLDGLAAEVSRRKVIA
ncbi:MAG: SRPBCC family protein [Actinomycetota bacterium]